MQGSFAIKRLNQEFRDMVRNPNTDYYAAPIKVLTSND